MLGALILLVAAGVIPWLSWITWRWWDWNQIKLGLSLPGPMALPFLGNALSFAGDPKDQLKLIEGIMRKHGQYVRMWMGFEFNVMVSNPEDIKLLLTSPKMTHKGPVYRVLRDVIGPGLLSGGSVWRNHRKLVTPSYNKKTVHNFSHLFNQEATTLVDVLYGKDPKETFNIYFDMVKTTTQCVCQTLMGQSKQESQNIKGLDEIVLKTQSMYGCVYAKMTKWYNKIPYVFWLIGGTKEINHFKCLIDLVCRQMIENRRKALARNETVDEDARSIIDRLIMSGELTDQEIIWETFTLFTTSQEASAKVASAVLIFLAHLPEWQDKVYNEILECVPDNDLVTGDDIKKLLHLDMVYKEVLRYLSIAALIQREVQEEITIDSGRITLPVGTAVTIPIHALHRDPTYWDEPHKVKPDRFLPENVKRRNPNAYVPFSLGPMDCLGRVYGTAMIKTMVVRILRHFKVESDGCLEDLDIIVAISVRFADGYNLRVVPRKQKNGGTIAAQNSINTLGNNGKK